jgi:hypothetical protein
MLLSCPAAVWAAHSHGHSGAVHFGAGEELGIACCSETAAAMKAQFVAPFAESTLTMHCYAVVSIVLL